MWLPFYNICLFFTFFYINRRKCWFCESFWHLVFYGFIHFRMLWTRFYYFWKMSVLEVCTGCIFWAQSKLIFLLPVRPGLLEKITFHLLAWSSLLDKSSLICQPGPSRSSNQARAYADLYHNCLWDPVHEKLKLLYHYLQQIHFCSC